MFRISKMTDYAILVLGVLAKQEGALLSATALARLLHLNVPTVSKILKILSEAALVRAVRGAGGGYILNKKASAIFLSDVVVAMEGSVSLTACCEKSAYCALDAFCTLKENWKKINNMMSCMLSQWTIVDMLQPLGYLR